MSPIPNPNPNPLPLPNPGPLPNPSPNPNLNPIPTSMQDSNSDPVIYITSFPGTGKLTIARHLTSYLTSHDIDSYLLDNHSLIEPVAQKYARTHPAYLPERKKERQKALKEWVEGSEGRGKWIVCTGTSLVQSEFVRWLF
jgi:hypothetical protein